MCSIILLVTLILPGYRGGIKSRASAAVPSPVLRGGAEKWRCLRSLPGDNVAELAGKSAGKMAVPPKSCVHTCLGKVAHYHQNLRREPPGNSRKSFAGLPCMRRVEEKPGQNPGRTGCPSPADTASQLGRTGSPSGRQHLQDRQTLHQASLASHQQRTHPHSRCHAGAAPLALPPAAGAGRIIRWWRAWTRRRCGRSTR
jgi:hypothetical protein